MLYSKNLGQVGFAFNGKNQKPVKPFVWITGLCCTSCKTTVRHLASNPTSLMTLVQWDGGLHWDSPAPTSFTNIHWLYQRLGLFLVRDWEKISRGHLLSPDSHLRGHISFPVEAKQHNLGTDKLETRKISTTQTWWSLWVRSNSGHFMILWVDLFDTLVSWKIVANTQLIQ